jgi:hypothetical protein
MDRIGPSLALSAYQYLSENSLIIKICVVAMAALAILRHLYGSLAHDIQKAEQRIRTINEYINLCDIQLVELELMKNLMMESEDIINERLTVLAELINRCEEKNGEAKTALSPRADQILHQQLATIKPKHPRIAPTDSIFSIKRMIIEVKEEHEKNKYTVGLWLEVNAKMLITIGEQIEDARLLLDELS